jgi:hypothetical protein
MVMATEEQEVPVEEEEQAPDITGEPEPEPAEEQEPAESPDDELAQLRAEIAELRSQLTKPQDAKSEAEIRQELQQQIRAEQELEQESRKREDADREELHDALQAALGAAGYVDVPVETVRRVGERFINKRYDQIANKEVGEVRNALVWIRELAEQGKSTKALSPRAYQYAQQLQGSFGAIFEKLKEQARTSPDLIPQDKLGELVEAEIEKRNARNRAGKTNIKRTDGDPAPTIDRSLEAVTNRIISNSHDKEDEEIWNRRFKR